MATPDRYIILFLLLICSFGSCKAEKPVQVKKPRQTVIIKPKYSLLTAEQRAELNFPEDLIAKMELEAGTEAEPFFVTVLMKSENLKGDKGFESRKLAGFSIRTGKADQLIRFSRKWLHPRGYLIFKSQKGYGHLQDVVTVIRGRSSYEILKIQETEAQNYNIDTGSIINWLKKRQHEGTFILTGAGSDWVEAHFINPPRDMSAFAKNIVAFAPDVLRSGLRTVKNLTEKMERDNGFFLVWD